MAEEVTCDEIAGTQLVWILDQPWGKWLEAFRDTYGAFHGYFAVSMCAFGLGANAVFVVILTRKKMESPINTILTSIACCDTGLMTSYLIWLVNRLGFLHKMGQTICGRYTRGWAFFSLFHANISVYLHAASLWLTVLLASVRWYCLRRERNMLGQLASLIQRVRTSIAFTLLLVVMLSVTNALCWTYERMPRTENGNCTVFDVVPSRLSVRNKCLLQDMNWWIGGIFHKTIPCCLLTVFMALLIYVMYKSRLRQKRLLSSRTRRRYDRQVRRRDGTTKLLVMIVFIFWITELPQGILTILTGYYGQWFLAAIYNNVGDLLDDLSLVNSSINFFLYCLMSSQFRQVFKHTFCIQHSTSLQASIAERRKYFSEQNMVRSRCCEADPPRGRPSAALIEASGIGIAGLNRNSENQYPAHSSCASPLEALPMMQMSTYDCGGRV